MNKVSLTVFAGWCFSLLSTLPGLAAEWPQWRGLHRDGVSAEQINLDWPAGGPEIRWHAAVGTGFSSLAVRGDRLYTLGNTNNQDTIWCLDARTGNPVWHFTYPSPLGPQYYPGGPGSTPTVDGNRVFTIGKWGDVFCLDADKGSILWKNDLRVEGLKPNRWGFAGAPLIWRDRVILNAGAAGTALDINSGRILWSTGTNATGYASPSLFNSNGKMVVLIFAAKHLVALDPATGKEMWRYPWETGWDTNNTDPLAYRDDVFISSFTRGCALLSVNPIPPQPRYESTNLFNHLSPGILAGDYLYAFNGEAKQDTDFRCIHLPTAQVKWTTKDPAFGSVICAGDKLLLLSDKGELVVSKISPEAFQPLARAKLLTGLCWTPPALADGFLYLRNAAGEIVCADLRNQHGKH